MENSKEIKKEVIFVVLEQYADWEYAFLATALQDRIQDKESPYVVKTLSLTTNSIKSIGGFTTIPDYDITNLPHSYSGLILIGGKSWRNEETKQLLPLVKQTYDNEKVLAAICDATVFLGMNSLLNEKKHTGNTLEDLSAASQDNYTGKDLYQQEQAVRDSKLITANGTAYLEFTKEVLLALDAYPVDYIENNYQFFKQGFIQFMSTYENSNS